MSNNVIAIDGTAGSGKGTIASHIAKKIGYYHLDTGLYYRSVAYLVLVSGISLDNKKEIIKITENLSLEFRDYDVIVNGNILSKELRSNEVNSIVGTICAIEEVRLLINDKIRKYVGDKKIVIDGRDIGSLVFPDAKFKFYVDASIDTRARRRYNQQIEAGVDANYDKILENIRVRDKISKELEFGALVVCDDAYVIDTTNDTIEETIDKVLRIIGDV